MTASGQLEVSVEITSAMVMFNRLAGRFTNWTPVAGGKLDVAVRDFLRRRFESEGRVGGGGRWVGLSPEYAAYKRMRVGRRKLLQYGGSMLDAYTKRRDSHQILTTSPDSYELSADETIQPRARAHQYGAPRINLPARVIIPKVLPKNFLVDLRNIVIGYVVHGEA